LEDVRETIQFYDSNWEPFFQIKDGDSIKITFGEDGGDAEFKCRFHGDMRVEIEGLKFLSYIFAEEMDEAGWTYEPVTEQEPKIDIVFAKYGEKLHDVSIPITEAALRDLVGGDYELTPVNAYSIGTPDMRVDGPDGAAKM